MILFRSSDRLAQVITSRARAGRKGFVRGMESLSASRSWIFQRLEDNANLMLDIVNSQKDLNDQTESATPFSP